jgi:hypothetical protein
MLVKISKFGVVHGSDAVLWALNYSWPFSCFVEGIVAFTARRSTDGNVLKDRIYTRI